MGASMIGVILQGPVAIDASLRDQVIAEGAAMFEDRIGNIDWDTAEEHDYADLATFCEACDLEMFDEQGFIEEEYSPAAVTDAITKSVDNFIGVWNRDILARDIAIRVFEPAGDAPAYQVCFAGGSSWGDTPDGIAFTAFDAVSALGLHSKFGCQ
ncbi:hypothetical protein J7355_15625 [Endozoicomonas sp. G2_2]|uniref:hypothetical protein n=1 Tax=Endozoicomonas sp. G2_2 TaxID=2821092 RepID=UPI001ADC377F|nr:hypothetical protein [Endozoicomonas sp. G2_2]MBO9471519.1 hypothetical protein [Endozoicomonas sp. G2_2]